MTELRNIGHDDLDNMKSIIVSVPLRQVNASQ